MTSFMDGAALTWEGDKMNSRPFERTKRLPIPSQAPGVVVARCWHTPGLLPINPFPAPHEEQPQQTQAVMMLHSHTEQLVMQKLIFPLSWVVRGHPLTKIQPKMQLPINPHWKCRTDLQLV